MRVRAFSESREFDWTFVLISCSDLVLRLSLLSFLKSKEKLHNTIRKQASVACLVLPNVSLFLRSSL